MTTLTATPTPAVIETQFGKREKRMQAHGLREMRAFLRRGIRFYVFRKRIEARQAAARAELDSLVPRLLMLSSNTFTDDNEVSEFASLAQHVNVLQEIERTSFWGWLHDPHNSQGSPNAASLSAQTVELWRVYFHIPFDDLEAIGVARFGILNPELELWRDDIRAGKRTWEAGREAALEWLASARTNTVKGLGLKMQQESIIHSRKTPSVGSTEAHRSHVDVLNEGFPMPAGKLRQMTREQLLDWLGLGSSDIADIRDIYAVVTAR